MGRLSMRVNGVMPLCSGIMVGTEYEWPMITFMLRL